MHDPDSFNQENFNHFWCYHDGGTTVHLKARAASGSSAVLLHLNSTQTLLAPKAYTLGKKWGQLSHVQFSADLALSMCIRRFHSKTLGLNLGEIRGRSSCHHSIPKNIVIKNLIAPEGFSGKLLCCGIVQHGSRVSVWTQMARLKWNIRLARVHLSVQWNSIAVCPRRFMVSSDGPTCLHLSKIRFFRDSQQCFNDRHKGQGAPEFSSTSASEDRISCSLLVSHCSGGLLWVNRHWGRERKSQDLLPWAFPSVSKWNGLTQCRLDGGD